MYLGTHIQYLVKLLSGENVMVRQPKTVESLPDNNTPVYVCWGTTDCLALPDQK